jgi:hypothetical protein
MRGLGVLVIGLVVLALAACDGAVMMSCTKTTGILGRHAECSGTVEKLDGSRLLTFDLEDIALGLSVNMRINVSVTSGAVEVRYQNSDGDARVYQVTPGSPLSVSEGLRVIMLDEGRMTLAAVGGIASGMRYEAEFTR